MQLNFFEHLHMAEVQNLATAAPAPEPAASALMMAGLAGAGGWRGAELMTLAAAEPEAAAQARSARSA